MDLFKELFDLTIKVEGNKLCLGFFFCLNWVIPKIK